MTLLPFTVGVAATVAALLMTLTWIAIGSIFLPRELQGTTVSAAAAILIGSSLTGFALSLFAAAGLVSAGVAVVTSASLVVLIVRRRHAATSLSPVAFSLRTVMARWQHRVTFVSIAAVMWLSAMAPPRNADAMRYHLAHLRQIIADGRWTAIPDYHLALPFGWTVNWLVFEMLGIPEAAQLIGILLFIALFAGLWGFLAYQKVSAWIATIAMLALLHPFVLRTFAEASADPYAIFTAFAIAALLARMPDAGTKEIAVLGFVAFVGVQSRYQLLAIGIATLGVALTRVGGDTERRAKLLALLKGIAAALLLASPFYVMNAFAFANPVWPLLIGESSSYADLVARGYTTSLTGSHTLVGILGSAGTLLTRPFLFPLPLLIVAAAIASSISANRTARDLGRVAAAFLVLWVLVQPWLYPRFIVMILPIAIAGGAIAASTRWPRAENPMMTRTAYALAFVLALVMGAASWDHLRFVATGDRNEFHRFTWYHPVYHWVNRALPMNSRLLVIVSSGDIYYLDRPWRRADPWLTGVIDWRRQRGADIAKILAAGRYSHVIYEDRDWSPFIGGNEMHRAISEAVEIGALKPVRSFDLRLYRSRVRRQFRPARVYVLETAAIRPDVSARESRSPR